MDGAQTAAGRRLAVMVGDRVNGEAVTGFAYVAKSPPVGHPRAEDDRLLVEGDEDLAAPPDRPVPLPGEEVEGVEVDRCGLTPLERLPQGRVRPAREVAAHLENSVHRIVFGAPPGGRFYQELTSRLDRMGHQLWVAGGAVRDLIADGEKAKVNDLDFTGTVPLGLMSEVAYQSLARADLSDLRSKVGRAASPHVSQIMVCSVQLPGHRDRLLEYKPLTLKGYRFPAFGGDLTADAATRDLTVNTLLFDLRRGVVLDPLNRGLADLLDSPRVLVVPYAHEDPVERATILLRVIKFVVRWTDEGLDPSVGDLRAWCETLPAGMVTAIPPDSWSLIETARRYTLKGVPPERQLHTARDLGSVPAELIAELDARGER
jgi:hypothetical protein